MKRRIISICCILSAFILFTAMNVFAEENSQSEILYSNRLKAMEVIPDDFDMDKEITRGEISEIVCRIYNLDYTSGGSRIFSDVDEDNPYYQAIDMVYTHGIISGFGDGSFRPNETITNEQMIKILISMTGYDDIASQYGGYPSGYMKIAGENDVLAPDTAGTDIVTGRKLAYSVYKAMEMPVVYIDSYEYGYMQYDIDSNKTLKENLMASKDLSYSQGIVNFDGITHINKAGVPDKGYAEINGDRFLSDINMRSLLGMCVEYWLKDNDTIIYAYEYKNKNNIRTFSSKDIDSADFSKYTVSDSNNKKTTIKLEKSINVIYNGQGMESFTEEDLIPQNGDVTFIDNDNDNLYEIVIINDKRYYVVDSVGNSGLSVKYKRYGVQTESGYYIKEDELDTNVYYIVYDEKGNEISPSLISADDVLSVAKSKNGNVISVTLTRKKIDGKIDSLTLKKININGTEYDIAIAADGEYTDLGVKVGKSTEAYLNENGEVVYCSDGISSDTVYAYIINTWIDENGETLYAKLVTAGNMGTLTNRKYWWVSDKLVQNDNVYEYKIADKAKVDGYKITSSLAESIKNKVCEIKVQHSETAGTEITKIDKLVPNFQYTKGKYNHNTSAMIQSDLSLMNYDNPAVLLSGNIKTLVVPVDTAEKYDDDCYMAKYRIENDVSTHNVEFYGIPKDSQTPKLLVMKTVLSEVGTAGGDNETCILTEGVSKGVNEDDEECYFAQAYDKNGNEITLTIRNDFRFADSSVKNAIMDLCAGDVMEIGRDGQNRVLEIKVMASASRPIDGTQMGIIEKLQQNVIWNKSNGDDFYNVFFYMNDDDERVEAGIKAEYPIFRYTQGRNGYVDKIGAADILTDENGVNADTVIIAGDIAVILPLD